jgi:hypothetical protein
MTASSNPTELEAAAVCLGTQFIIWPPTASAPDFEPKFRIDSADRVGLIARASRGRSEHGCDRSCGFVLSGIWITKADQLRQFLRMYSVPAGVVGMLL